MRVARTGALATFDVETRLPLATLVGVASDWDGAPLFLLSELARHTKNLAGDARASLLLTSARRARRPAQPAAHHARRPDRDPRRRPSAKQRYLRRNPKAKLYAVFADFSLRRMRIESVHFNGGFGRADALTRRGPARRAGDVSELIAAEDELLAEVDALGDAALPRLAEGASVRAAGLARGGPRRRRPRSQRRNACRRA